MEKEKHPKILAFNVRIQDEDFFDFINHYSRERGQQGASFIRSFLVLGLKEQFKIYKKMKNFEAQQNGSA